MAANGGEAPAARPGEQDAPGWDEGGWRVHAACRGEDPELFFPVGSAGPALTQIAEAKEVCARCPVREACLDFALSTGQDYGIWGGLTENERRSLRVGSGLPHAGRPLVSALPGSRQGSTRDATAPQSMRGGTSAFAAGRRIYVPASGCRPGDAVTDRGDRIR